MNHLEKYIDHTLLKPDADLTQFDKLISEAITHSFFSVCIPPSYVAYAAKKLKGSRVKVCTVIGFPLGYSTSKTKIFETSQAIADGADEIDMVINVSEIKNKNYQLVENEISEIAKICHQHQKILKVIIETANLSQEEIIVCCRLVKNSKADFIKTSTGFAASGAKVEDIKLMKEQLGDAVKIKASGGIKDLKTAQAMIAAGASRLGTSSGVAILEGKNSSSAY